jgi:uncharacterized protein YkwD
MRGKTLLSRKAVAVVFALLVGVGVAACAPPPPAPAPSSSASGGPSDSFESQLLQAVNADRASQGLPAFQWNEGLGGKAAAWAQQMAAANSLYHQNLSALLGDPCCSGFHTLGENIMQGPGSMSAGSIEAAWRGSAAHWANITNRAFNYIGIGYYRGPDGRIWAVQDFGG